MMDRAAAAGPRRAGLRSHPTAGLSGAVMSRYRTCRPAVSEAQRVREAFAAVTFGPPFKSAGLTLSGLKYYHDPHAISQPDKPLINIRLIHHFLQYGMWIITDFSVCTGMTRALPGKRPLLVPARLRNPQHFHRLCTGLAPLRTSHPHVCAQAAGKQSCVGWQAAADRHRRRYLLARPARRVREAETRWSHRPPLPGRDRRPPLPGSRRPQVGAKSRARLRPRRHRHDQGVSQPETTTRCRWLPNSMRFIGCCGHSCIGCAEPRYLCDAGQQPIVGF